MALKDNVLLGQTRSKHSEPSVKIADFGWARMLPKGGMLLGINKMTGGVIPACNRPPEIWLATGICFVKGRWVSPSTAMCPIVLEHECLMSSHININYSMCRT